MIAIHRFHLEHEISASRVHLRGEESATIRLKATTSFMPATSVKGIEIITPLKFEVAVILIVFIDLDIVIENIPGHVNWIKTSIPASKIWNPEIHHQVLLSIL